MMSESPLTTKEPASVLPGKNHLPQKRICPTEYALHSLF